MASKSKPSSMKKPSQKRDVFRASQKSFFLRSWSAPGQCPMTVFIFFSRFFDFLAKIRGWRYAAPPTPGALAREARGGPGPNILIDIYMFFFFVWAVTFRWLFHLKSVPVSVTFHRFFVSSLSLCLSICPTICLHVSIGLSRLAG